MANPVFSCAKCGQPLDDIPPSGRLTTLCVNCELVYEVVRGDVVGIRAERTRGAGAEPDTACEVTVRVGSGREEQIRFTLSVDDSAFVTQTGDVVSAVYLLRGEKREQLLSIHNATSGRAVTLSFPGEVAAQRSWWVAAVVAVILAIALETVGGPFLAVTGFVAALFGLRAVSARVFAPYVVVTDEHRLRYAAKQRLLNDKLRLEAGRSAASRDREQMIETQQRLQALRAKMAAFGSDMYRARITSIDAAIGLIQQQLTLHDKAREGYARNIGLIEIELEAGATVSTLTAAAGTGVESIVAEIADIDEQRRELGRQIEANAEVEALLKNSSS